MVYHILRLHGDYVNFWFCVQLVWLLCRFSWSLWVIRSFDNLCLLVLEKKLKNDIFHNITDLIQNVLSQSNLFCVTLSKKILKILTSLYYWYPSIHKRLVFLNIYVNYDYWDLKFFGFILLVMLKPFTCPSFFLNAQASRPASTLLLDDPLTSIILINVECRCCLPNFGYFLFLLYERPLLCI